MRLFIKTISVALTFVILLSASVYASAVQNVNYIYVDIVNGSDTNNGSQANPFKTITRAADKARVSIGKQNVILSDGVYEISDIAYLRANPGQVISYSAVNNGLSTIKTSGTADSVIQNNVFSGITFECLTGIKLANSENIEFNSCVFKNSEDVAITIGAKCKKIRILNCRFENLQSSAIHIVDGKNPKNAPADCAIENCNFVNCAMVNQNNGVIFAESGNNISISKNNISDYKGCAIECGQSYNSAQKDKTLENIKITNNFIYTDSASLIPVRIYGNNGAIASVPNLLSGNYIMSDYSPSFSGIELGNSSQYWCIMKNVVQGFGTAIKLRGVLKNSISINDNYCDIYDKEPIVTDVQNTIFYRCFNGMRSGNTATAAANIIKAAGNSTTSDGDELMRVMPDKRIYELYPDEKCKINVKVYNKSGEIIDNNVEITYSVEDDKNISVSQDGIIEVKEIPLGDVKITVKYKDKSINSIIKVIEKIKNDVDSVTYSTKGILRPFVYDSRFFSARVHNYMEFTKKGTTTYTVNVPDNSEYRLYMSVLKDKNMGKFKIYVNDKLLNQEFDFYGDEQMHICDLGSIQNCKKGAKVKIECIGNNPLSAGTAFLTTGFHLAK